MSAPPDLTKQPPRSPRLRVCGFAILGRTIDKCRALLNGNVGEYHFDCPLDKMLFEFLGVNATDFKNQLEASVTDEQIAVWAQQGGRAKTTAELEQWNTFVEGIRPFDDPAKRDWFVQQCEPLRLDPAQTTLFDLLDADDRASTPAEFK